MLAQPSFAVDKSTHLEADEVHRTRHGFFRSSAPRLPTMQRPLTVDLEPLEYVAGEHVERSHLSLTQTVKVSPQRLKVMSSRASRFTTPLTYAAGETRDIAPLREPYDTGLGPGSYRMPEPGADGHDATKPNYVFMSGSPRLHRPRMPLSVGGNVSSVEADRASWAEPHTFVAKAQRGLDVDGPQPGSYEDREGLGRAISPVRRSPDKAYTTDLSVQKRPLAMDVASSSLRYSPAFRSSSPRLQISIDERRSLDMPAGATDAYDLSASASRSAFMPINAQVLSSSRSQSTKSLHETGAMHRTADPAATPPPAGFGSTLPRFAPLTAPVGLQVEVMDCFESDRKKWHANGQPLTGNGERESRALKCNTEEELSPGPGSYIQPRMWKASNEPDSSTRRRLKL